MICKVSMIGRGMRAVYSPQLERHIVVVYGLYVLYRLAPKVVQACEVMYREPRWQLPLIVGKLCCDHSGHDVRAEMYGHQSGHVGKSIRTSQRHAAFRGP